MTTSKLTTPSLGYGSISTTPPNTNKTTRTPARRDASTPAPAQASYSPSLGQHHSNPTNTLPPKATPSRRRQPARQSIPPGLRFQILQRDGFRCCLCGASTANRQVELEIDHIIPISRGGTNDPHNLQTLCRPCNLGKSNHLLE